MMETDPMTTTRTGSDTDSSLGCGADPARRRLTTVERIVNYTDLSVNNSFVDWYTVY